MNMNFYLNAESDYYNANFLDVDHLLCRAAESWGDMRPPHGGAVSEPVREAAGIFRYL